MSSATAAPRARTLWAALSFISNRHMRLSIPDHLDARFHHGRESRAPFQCRRTCGDDARRIAVRIRADTRATSERRGDILTVRRDQIAHPRSRPPAATLAPIRARTAPSSTTIAPAPERAGNPLLARPTGVDEVRTGATRPPRCAAMDAARRPWRCTNDSRTTAIFAAAILFACP